MFLAESCRNKEAATKPVNYSAEALPYKGLQLPAVPAFTSASPTSSTPVIQRKILINENPFTPTTEQPEPVKHAMADEFNRYYPDETAMQNHLVTKSPVPFGLIKKRALWYDLKDLANQFFVLGESHAAVRGTDIEKESNLIKPVLYEGRPEWSVNKFKKKGNEQIQKNKGTDETSSKLLQALRVFGYMVEKGNKNTVKKDRKPPDIPLGNDRTRDTRDGSYKLVIKGKDDQAEYWKPQEAPQVAPKEYDALQESGQAVLTLFKRVFYYQIKKGKLNEFHFGLEMAWETIEDFIKKPADVPKRFDSFLNIIMEATDKKVKRYYKKLTDKQGTDLLKSPDDPTLKEANDYRNEFILHAIAEAARSGTFSFAAVGNAHLKALESRLGNIPVNSISLENFMSNHTRDAV